MRGSRAAQPSTPWQPGLQGGGAQPDPPSAIEGHPRVEVEVEADAGQEPQGHRGQRQLHDPQPIRTARAPCFLSCFPAVSELVLWLPYDCLSLCFRFEEICRQPGSGLEAVLMHGSELPLREAAPGSKASHL